MYTENLIKAELIRIERDMGVRIIYACEAGSRAWGFASPYSDYDVRFIYTHNLEWYLSIDERKDTIEYPLKDGIEFAGWDIKKALKLMRKSNPPLLEWLNSPTVYLEERVITKMRELSEKYYSPQTAIYHYLHMAEGNYREYLTGETILLKKYFYVLRPILAIHWIKENPTKPIPTDFNVLFEGISSLSEDMKQMVRRLISIKKEVIEIGMGRRIAIVSNFLEREIKSMKNDPFIKKPNNYPDSSVLDKLLIEIITEYGNA